MIWQVTGRSPLTPPYVQYIRILREINFDSLLIFVALFIDFFHSLGKSLVACLVGPQTLRMSSLFIFHVAKDCNVQPSSYHTVAFD